jgi:predicted transcriptional regulator
MKGPTLLAKLPWIEEMERRRLERGWSGADLAREAKVSESLVSRLRSHNDPKEPFSSRGLDRIALVLEMPMPMRPVSPLESLLLDILEVMAPTARESAIAEIMKKRAPLPK